MDAGIKRTVALIKQLCSALAPSPDPGVSFHNAVLIFSIRAASELRPEDPREVGTVMSVVS